MDAGIVRYRPLMQRNPQSPNLHNPLSAMDLRENQWNFHVVCLNAPNDQGTFSQSYTRLANANANDYDLYRI